MSVNQFLSNATKTNKRKSKKLEVNTEDKFRDYAKTQGCLALKLALLGLRGFPDRTIVCPGGRIFFIEFKRTSKEKLSTNQEKWKRKLEGFGFEFYTMHDLEESKQVLDEFLL